MPGFALYFGYGMWNSSEEYVSKGKIPPGGTSPLPPKTIDAVASAAVTASVGIVPDPIVATKMPLHRALIPVTSLDDDIPLKKENLSFEEAEKEFGSAIEESHLAAQEVFDKARHQREMALFMSAILQSHQLSEQVFQQIKSENQAKQLEIQKQMATLAQEADQLHKSLEDIFANMKATPVVQPPPSPRPAGPLTAVMEELKNKTSLVDGQVDSDDENQPIQSVSETVTQNQTPDEPGSPLETDSPGNASKASNTSSNLMLSELKKAFHRAIKTGEDEEDDMVNNIAPSAVAMQRRDSPQPVDHDPDLKTE